MLITALRIRILKYADGNYLWNHAKVLFLGRQITTKLIVFVDFSYYWIIDRESVLVRKLIERLTLLGQAEYLAFKFIDGKLINRDVVKFI